MDELNKVLELRSENDIELHNEQFRKNGIISLNDYSSSSLYNFKYEKLEELKNVKYIDLEDMVYRCQLNYDGFIDIIVLKYNPTKRIGYPSNPRIYEIADINTTLKYILPKTVKVIFTIDDMRLKSN